jgi:hypothetical protein
MDQTHGEVVKNASVLLTKVNGLEKTREAIPLSLPRI